MQIVLVLSKKAIYNEFSFLFQDNNALLKEIFGRIDPSAVSGSYGKYFGEIEVALKYKSSESTLLVKIGRARNLPTPDAHRLPDPFVQAALVIKRYDLIYYINTVI